MSSKKNRQVYICYTIYHLLISILYSLLHDGESVIIIMTNIANAELYSDRIQKNFPHIKVKVLNDESFASSRLCYSPEVHRLYQQSIGQGDINLFNEGWRIGRYLHRNKIPYTLMEDGLNCLQHVGSIPSLKQRIRLILTYKPIWHGYSKYCKQIIVNEIKGIPLDSRQSKFIERPKKELLLQLSQEDREKILAIFDVQPLTLKSSAALILTQPLEIEFQDEVARLKFWKNLIDKYRDEGYNVYVKVHPRDTLDYSSFPVTILPKNVPAELLDFVVDRQFSIGVTYYSTALEFMGCVQEKVYLFWEK